MTYADAMEALLALARANNGVIRATQVEANEALSRERTLVCAAARALAASTSVSTTPADSPGHHWFPYTTLVVGDPEGDDDRSPSRMKAR